MPSSDHSLYCLRVSLIKCKDAGMSAYICQSLSEPLVILFFRLCVCVCVCEMLLFFYAAVCVIMRSDLLAGG